MRSMSIPFAAVLVLAGCASAPEAGHPAGHGAASQAATPHGAMHQGGHCGMHAARAEPAVPLVASSAAPPSASTVTSTAPSAAQGHASMKHCGPMKAHGQAAQP